MNTLELLSKYLGSPIVAHRQRAIVSLFKEVFTNPKALNSIGLNLQSDNFDIVQNSLRVLLAVSYRNAKKTQPIYERIMNLAKKSNHFAIVKLCYEILVQRNSKDLNTQGLLNKLIPKLTGSLPSDEYFYDNCNHSLEYLFQSKDCAYELAHICKAFRYDCKKAEKQVIKYMKGLGYKKGSQYWRERPDYYEYDFEGKRYETRLHYISRHSIQKFLFWCIENLSISKESLEELLNYERNWDPSIPQLLIQQQPEIIKFPDIKLERQKWLKKKIIKNDAYNLISQKKLIWFPLYESTRLKTGGKSFDKYVSTCFIRTPIGKISKKNSTPTVNYKCDNCYINEVPEIADKNGLLIVQNESNGRLQNKLVPNYGYIEDDFDTYFKLFPAPEIINYFKLKRKENTLEFYKGSELVAQCINWQGGYHKNIGAGREERYELSNYGNILFIKTKYLRHYMNQNKLKLFATGSITKHLTDDYRSSFKQEDYKYKWLPFEIVNL